MTTQRSFAPEFPRATSALPLLDATPESQAWKPRPPEARPRHADLLLVGMPFGPQVLQPSLGLSLLKAAVHPLGITTEVRYFTLKFAARIGLAHYRDVAYLEPTIHGFAGEWVFNGALFDRVEHDVEGYVEDILRGRSAGFREARANLRPVAEEVIERMLELRRQAAPFVEECLAEVLALRPRIVGFTSTFQQQVAALALARRIREEAPETFVVFGGANCEGVMGAEMLRQFPFVDAVVSGEGDAVFPELVRRVLAGAPHHDIQGVNTPVNSGFPASGKARFTTAPMVQDLDSLPIPDCDDFFEQFAETDLGLPPEALKPRLMFETSRGCWWGEKSHCTFCGLNGATMHFRAKSEARALAELTYFHRRFPGCGISVTDNILDMKYFRSFVPELARRGMDLELFYEVKANLRKEQVRLLAEAGVRDIQPGVESFLDSVLKLMRKGVSGAQNVQLLKWCKEFGVKPHWNLLWGFPGESPEEYRRMADLLPWLSHLPPAGGGGLIRLDRFSPNFHRAAEMGFTRVSPYPAYPYVYPLAPEAVANLAYFFTFDYQEPRDVPSYTAELRARLAAWKEGYESSDLFYVDKEGRLLIWDLRPVAIEPLSVLTGVQRSAYLACDAVCSRARLLEVLAADGSELSEEELEALLAPLVERGLLLRDGQGFLSLAIPLGSYSPSSPVVARFQEVARRLGASRRQEGGTTVIPVPSCPTESPALRAGDG